MLFFIHIHHLFTFLYNVSFLRICPNLFVYFPANFFQYQLLQIILLWIHCSSLWCKYILTSVGYISRRGLLGNREGIYSTLINVIGLAKYQFHVTCPIAIHKDYHCSTSLPNHIKFNSFPLGIFQQMCSYLPLLLKEFRTCYPKICWHIDYFELKALEKQQMHEEHSDLPSLSSKQEMKFPCGRCPPYTRRKVTFLSPAGNGENSVQTVLVKIIHIFLCTSHRV